MKRAVVLTTVILITVALALQERPFGQDNVYLSVLPYVCNQSISRVNFSGLSTILYVPSIWFSCR